MLFLTNLVINARKNSVLTRKLQWGQTDVVASIISKLIGPVGEESLLFATEYHCDPAALRCCCKSCHRGRTLPHITRYSVLLPHVMKVVYCKIVCLHHVDIGPQCRQSIDGCIPVVHRVRVPVSIQISLDLKLPTWNCILLLVSASYHC